MVENGFVKNEEDLNKVEFFDHTAELFERLDAKSQKEKQFKGKVIEIFKKNNFGTPEDIAFLEGLAS
ncbi:MAG: hypothetical protein AAB579_03985 [Patescibacteria group bacterium]